MTPKPQFIGHYGCGGGTLNKKYLNTTVEKCNIECKKNSWCIKFQMSPDGTTCWAHSS